MDFIYYFFENFLFSYLRITTLHVLISYVEIFSYWPSKFMCSYLLVFLSSCAPWMCNIQYFFFCCRSTSWNTFIAMSAWSVSLLHSFLFRWKTDHCEAVKTMELHSRKIRTKTSKSWTEQNIKKKKREVYYSFVWFPSPIFFDLLIQF